MDLGFMEQTYDPTIQMFFYLELKTLQHYGIRLRKHYNCMYSKILPSVAPLSVDSVMNPWES